MSANLSGELALDERPADAASFLEHLVILGVLSPEEGAVAWAQYHYDDAPTRLSRAAFARVGALFEEWLRPPRGRSNLERLTVAYRRGLVSASALLLARMTNARRFAAGGADSLFPKEAADRLRLETLAVAWTHRIGLVP